MRTLLIVLLSSISLSSFAQDSSHKYYFKEVGWRIDLPADYIVVGNKAAMQIALNGSKSDPTGLNILLSAGKSSGEMFQAGLSRYSARIIDFKRVVQAVKDSNYVTLLKTIPGAQLDSSSSAKTIDGKLFDKFHIEIHINGRIIDYFLLSKLYNGANFEITYVYATDHSRQEIETMLKNSKFDK
jgi:hypothetical protein